MKASRWLVLAGIALALLLFIALDLDRFLTLDYLQQRQQDFARLYARRPWEVRSAYFVLYLAVASLSLPGAVLLTLAGGAVFGFFWGLLLVSFASTLGATVSFHVSRLLLRDWVQARFAIQLAEINAGVARAGALYLLSLRLIPVVPFFLINLTMGLTQLPTWTFYWVSQLGMMAATAVFVNAGMQLATLKSLSDVASPALLGSFALIGVFPLLVRRVWRHSEKRQVFARWQPAKPKTFDRNLVVIGAGAGGRAAARTAANLKASVTLVDACVLGGNGRHSDRVRSRALVRSAAMAQQMRHAQAYGLPPAHPAVDIKAVLQWAQRAMADMAHHHSMERYTALGVDVVQGRARITSPWTVEIALAAGGTQVLTTRAIVIAAGAQPFVPSLPGLEEAGYLTGDTLWEHLTTLDTLPKRWVVLGGGPVGCELSQAFARFGAEVTLAEIAPRLLMREDEDVAALTQAALQADGVQVLTNHHAVRCEWQGDTKVLVLSHHGQEVRMPFDRLVCATGRVPALTGYGLEALGIPTDATPITDDTLQTPYPNIYAAGDVAGPYQSTHAATHQAWYAAVNALFGDFKRLRVNYAAIPEAVFVDPEIARVGLNEHEAKARGLAYEVTRYELADLDWAMADGNTKGFVKVLTAPGKDRILGATIVGAHAADLLAEYGLAMQHGLGLKKILATVHSYPTLAEANKHAASQWRDARQTLMPTRWLKRLHDWRRT